MVQQPLIFLIFKVLYFKFLFLGGGRGGTLVQHGASVSCRGITPKYGTSFSGIMLNFAGIAPLAQYQTISGENVTGQCSLNSTVGGIDKVLGWTTHQPTPHKLLRHFQELRKLNSNFFKWKTTSISF